MIILLLSVDNVKELLIRVLSSLLRTHGQGSFVGAVLGPSIQVLGYCLTYVTVGDIHIQYYSQVSIRQMRLEARPELRHVPAIIL